MNVLFLASEADPLVKVGGLGDVAGSLPRALRSLSTTQEAQDVRLILPFHSQIRNKITSADTISVFSIPYLATNIEARVLQSELNGVPLYLIDGLPIPDGAPVYSLDTQKDAEKFVFFSLAALEFIRRSSWNVQILHANDWHTAIAVYMLEQKRRIDPSLSAVRSVLTVHNLPFMGAGSENALSDFGIPAETNPVLPWWARHFPLPLGLLAADKIVAVSPTYAREMLTPDFGCGLETLLLTKQNCLTGILNGLDTCTWDPETDIHLAKRYSAETIISKKENKKRLLGDFSLMSDTSHPLLAMVSRMDRQKGIDIAVEGLRQVADLPWQAIFLGTGDPELEKICLALQAEFPGRVRTILAFDSGLSHRIYAGSDMLMMPSRYEPCGLSQMIAMHYGCIPVARSTGGLRDSIHYEPSLDSSTGFLFSKADGASFGSILNIAIDQYHHPSTWQLMQKRGMAQDFSWHQSAMSYARIYNDLKEWGA